MLNYLKQPFVNFSNAMPTNVTARLSLYSRMYQKHITLSIILALGTTMIFLFILKPEEPTDEAPSFPARKAELTANVMHDEALFNLVNSIDINEFRKLLQPILVERVVGTAGHEAVKNYIVNELQKLKWEVELYPFEDKTPDNKKLNFTNIVATYKSDAPKLLVLSCHYDSKLSNFLFIGATDSAVPCAMLLYLAKNLDGILRKLPLTVGLQLIFFDGEEAFVHWTPRDSLYGARHLAGVLTAKTFDAARNINHIKRMSLFVLLDLLGAPSPEFYSYFENTNKWYSSLIQIEKRLLAKGLLQSDLRDGIQKPYFNDLTFYGAGIDDDHKPFLRRGVPVVHLIPYPFPDVWHTERDDESAVNYVTVNNLLKILKVFVLEYLMTSSAS